MSKKSKSTVGLVAATGSRQPGDRILAHVRGCAICQSGTWCKTANRLGVTREQRDATVAFDRALNPDKQAPR